MRCPVRERHPLEQRAADRRRRTLSGRGRPRPAVLGVRAQAEPGAGRCGANGRGTSRVMLDGNRRWARDAGFADVNDGHRVGAAKIADLLGWCEEAGVEVVTLWLLSTDNLNAPGRRAASRCWRSSPTSSTSCAGPAARWRLRVVGRARHAARGHGRPAVRGRGAHRGPPGLELNVAVGYGGRQEIADAVRKLLLQHAESGTSIEELAEVLDVDHIAAHLYTSGQPDPDLVIRTSGEQRLSGFLLWQSRALGVLVLRGLLAGVPPGRLPARAARLRRPAPPVRLLIFSARGNGAGPDGPAPFLRRCGDQSSIALLDRLVDVGLLVADLHVGLLAPHHAEERQHAGNVVDEVEGRRRRCWFGCSC